jgi:hypothetical protein
MLFLEFQTLEWCTRGAIGPIALFSLETAIAPVHSMFSGSGPTQLEDRFGDLPSRGK